MAIKIDELKIIFDRIIADYESSLNQTTPAIEIAFNRVLAAVDAGEFATCQRHALDRQKQCFPQFARDEFLEAWGELMNEPRQSASPAIFEATATGNDGKVIESGSLGPRWITANGLLFFNKTTETIVGGVATLNIECITAGTIGNLLPLPQNLTIISPEANLDNQITVTAEVQTGRDGQIDEDYQDIITFKVARPPRGGSVADYFFWGRSVPNFIDIFPYAGNLPGKVDIYGVVDNQPDGIPTPAQLTELYNHLIDPTRITIWSEDVLPNGDQRLNVYASPVIEFVVTVINMLPLVQTLIDAVELAIQNYFLSRKPYIGGLTLRRNSDLRKNKLTSIIDEQIDSLGGISFDNVTFALVSDPTTILNEYTMGIGQRAKTTVVFV